MTLNEKQFDLINFIEQEYLAHGIIPTADRMVQVDLCSAKEYKELLENQEVRTNLLARGLPLSSFGLKHQDILTEEQLTTANVMLDLRDNRSQKKKLADLGIATQKWEAWLADPGFQNYLRQRSEKILGDNSHEANLALLDRIRSGDTGAIKFYYEITGRYVPNRGDSVNLPALLMRIMEIIQKHVLDDTVASAIADEFLVLAKGVGIANAAVGGSNVRQLEGGVIDL